MLVCVYGRARWSDFRFIHHVSLEEGRSGYLTLYTTEHKTCNTGARREQFLLLVVPLRGITQEDWVAIFVQVYEQLGLDIHKVPLGPLLPAPRSGNTFGARPLCTSEAARWLRLLLTGTAGHELFRAHSLKTTLLVWSAKASLEKEIRALLGHHAKALEGSEVVYSRYLQTRALRKLCMLLHRVRLGLGIETDPMGPNPFATPVGPTRGLPPTPLAAPAAPCTPMPIVAAPVEAEAALDKALEDVNAKEELIGDEQAAEAADQISLFNIQLVNQGVVQIESSSGSDSESSYDSSSSSTGEAVVRAPKAISCSERAPDGFKCFKHKKSAIMHKARMGCNATACGVLLTSLQEMPEVITVRWPKCLRCFPKDPNRLKTPDDLNNALGSALKRARER